MRSDAYILEKRDRAGPLATKRGGAMKKKIGKKLLAREALFWGKMKNTLSRPEIKVCRK